jgi:hypothetical protein
MMNDQQIIVFGGADRCGKTEISTALSRVINVPRFKASSEHETFLAKQNMFVEQLRHADTRMVDFLRQTGHSVIMDRAWPCEFAYSRFYGRPTDENVLRYVDDEMAKMGAKVIICWRSSYEGIVDDLSSQLRGQKLKMIEDEYRKFARWTKCQTLFLNVDDENLYREVSDIVEWLGINDTRVTSRMKLWKLSGSHTWFK